MPDKNKTVIVNNTQQELNMQVGNHRYFMPLGSLPKGARHTLHVDYNDTYQEFLMGEDKSGKKLIVTSDDCCDFQCITITETDGTFAVHREPRQHHSNLGDGGFVMVAAPAPKKRSTSSWKFWKS